MTVSNHPTSVTEQPIGGASTPLWRALGWSVLVHLLILFAVRPSGPPNDVLSTGQGPQRFSARLGAPRPVAGEQVQPELMRGRLPAAITAPRPVRRPATATQVLASAVPATPYRVPEAPPVMPLRELRQPAAAAEGATADRVATEVSTLPVPIGGAGGALVRPADTAAGPAGAESAEDQRGAAEASLLAEYRQALVKAALGYKRYPPLARERGWQGTVELTLVLLPRHPSPVLRVSRGTGFALLDEQALDMMSRAVRRLPVPDALQSLRTEFVIPIRFTLGD